MHAIATQKKKSEGENEDEDADEHRGDSKDEGAEPAASPANAAEIDDLMAQLSLGAEASSEIRQTLVLLDFNGTLVHRYKEGDTRDKWVKQEPDFEIRFGKMWVRPHASELLEKLLNDPRCRVGVYTSMKRRNMLEVVKGWDAYGNRQSAQRNTSHTASDIASIHSSLQLNMIDIFDRPYNKLDPEGENDWDTMRDLSLIWDLRRIKDMGFDKTNTVLIEADPSKARNFRDNAVLPKEFTARDVGQGDNTLQALSVYLEDVFAEMQQGETDVRDILAAKRFH
jgi:hypothetical protein